MSSKKDKYENKGKNESKDKKEKKGKYTDSVQDINAIRQQVVTEDFRGNIGKKALVMIGQYPFLIIGNIKEVVSDYVFIKAEFTNIAALDGFLYRVHIDDIEVYFIETKNHKIPHLDVFGEEC
ncbi:MAG: hypothetical protein ACI35P_07255 [Bacillus sp. (in: firmicutes)]